MIPAAAGVRTRERGTEGFRPSCPCRVLLHTADSGGSYDGDGSVKEVKLWCYCRCRGGFGLLPWR